MLKRAELFEHQTVRVGEKLVNHDGGNGAVLTDAEHRAIDRFNRAHGERFFRVGLRDFTTTQFVGYLQVGNLAIEILPKADRGTRKQDPRPWRDGLLEMLKIATGIRLETMPDSAQSVTRSSLIDVVALRFAEETERLLHQGLAKGYREVEENLPTFRGRLVFAEHLLANVARADRFFVRYPTYDWDVTVNRIVGLALQTLEKLSLSPGTATRVARCRSSFPDVSKVRLTPDLFDRVRLGRTTERYRSALVLARMILEQTTPELTHGRMPVFALLFDMNVVWERFIRALFKRAAPASLAVTSQDSRAFWKPGVQRSRTVRPDIVVRRRSDNSVRLVADTKWKVAPDGNPSDDDLRQMFVYNELFGAPESVLLYPGVKNASARRGSYLQRAHTCASVHLGLFEDGQWRVDRLRRQVSELLSALDTG